ncbi:HET-domain-containing protein [Cadophora sp. DSE1049]|nr:HET-domain-containing protein [Cadophora sp. DSE1049]
MGCAKSDSQAKALEANQNKSKLRAGDFIHCLTDGEIISLLNVYLVGRIIESTILPGNTVGRDPCPKKFSTSVVNERSYCVSMPLSRRLTKATIKKSLQRLRYHKELHSRQQVASYHDTSTSENVNHTLVLHNPVQRQDESLDDSDEQESSEDTDDSSSTYVAPRHHKNVDSDLVWKNLMDLPSQREPWIPPEQIYLMQSDRLQPIAGLCNSCSQLNFEAIARGDGNASKDPRAFSLQTIGTINRAWSQRACRLCRFFAEIWEPHQSYLRGAYLCLVLLSSQHLSQYAGTNQVHEGQNHRAILLLSHPQTERTFDVDSTTLDNLDIVGPIFIEGSQATSGCISARSLDRNKVDFSVIGSWLRICSSRHGDSCSSSAASRVTGLQLLNCTTRKLEPYRPGARFIALSYVWGTNVDEQRHQDDDHDHLVLPQTIQDALTVTLEIGFQYLWVDRYCIPQLDEHAKHLQIIAREKS